MPLNLRRPTLGGKAPVAAPGSGPSAPPPLRTVPAGPPMPGPGPLAWMGPPPGYGPPTGYAPQAAYPAGAYAPGMAGPRPPGVLGAAPVAGQAAPALPQRFRYKWQVLAVARIVGYGLLVLAIWHLAQTILVAGQTFIQWHNYNDWKALIGGFVGALLALVMAALIVNAVPTFQPTGDGLVLRGFLRPLTIPWSRIALVRAMELPGDRYVVFVEYNGTPLAFEHQVYALLAGVGRRPGVFLTSHLDHFEGLLRMILRQRIAVTPPGLPGSTVESLLDEQAQLPLFQMLFDPQVTAVRVADLPAPDPDAPADDFRQVLSALAERPAPAARPLWQLQVGVALLPVAAFWIDGLTRGFLPDQATVLATVGLLALGLLELPLVGLVTQALGESLYGQGLSKLITGVYPSLELPRAVAFLPIFALLALQGALGGLVPVLVTLLWLAAAGWVAYLTTLFIMRLYQINIRQAATVGAASFALQFVMALVYLFLR